MDYGYDKVHDRTYERFGASGSAGDAFEYDKARRLTKAWMGSSTPASPSGNTYVKTIAYAMDDDGNRTSVVVTPYGQSAQTTSYTTNNLNQYTAVGSTSPSYDANGNLTNDGTLTFKYNYKNLICEVRTSSGGTLVAMYAYDANGRRISKDVNGGSFERYVYADVETVSVYDGSHAWKQDFVYDVTGIDRVLMLEQKDVLDQDGDANTTELTRSYYHRNALGSVMEISTASQTEAASYRYTPYGAVTITQGGSVQSSDPLGQHWGFTDRFHDAETGLAYFRARYQDPATGRFLQRDPLGTYAGPNAYQYCDSWPTTLVDPLGLVGNEDVRPLGPQPVGFNPQITGSNGNLYAGGQIGHFQQSLSLLGAIPGLCMRQELRVAIHLWKQGEGNGPSRTIRVHIVEYFAMYGGKTGGDTHRWQISRQLMDEGYCAFLVNVWAKIEVGRVKKPLEGWSYSIATVADSGGETSSPKDFNMSSSRTMGDPGNNRIADPEFTALTQPSYYTYSQSANWCADRNLRGRIPGKCPDNLRRPRPTTDSDSGAVTTPSEPSMPTEPPPPGSPGGR